MREGVMNEVDVDGDDDDYDDYDDAMRIITRTTRIMIIKKSKIK